LSKFWSSRIKNSAAYVPGEQINDGTYIKLNTNENPYPPSREVLDTIRSFDSTRLNLYPDFSCHKLKSALAQKYGLNKNEIFISNGSDEALAFSFLAFFDCGDSICFPSITYSFYKVYADFFNINYTETKLTESFEVDLSVFDGNYKGVVFANPNAPTGKSVSFAKIKSFLERNPEKLVIVDEAYVDFGGQSVVPLIHKHDNLLVTQTFSKSRALAGLRVGFAMGNINLINALEQVKNSINSYTLDTIALESACASLRDDSHFKTAVSKIINTRTEVSEKLRLLGFMVIESKANFVFISHPGFSAENLYSGLKEKHVLVRHFNSPDIQNFLRVSIGTHEQMSLFLNLINELTIKL